ncbi:hypothetical protein PNEG_03244 [Pneumocystis murina B123]|uniref:C2H2-type domain-containing protein n=1 Tax=Pneumocystis murina (strain B123) TaxID=1069680 RepID=M7NIJ8_PNEMU|nr:hypothetical protein PNEG_03244 [Pneumocystis murina B123]EMR08408.1 hypothetical protein PNEG_03244 [Pneumocystis murina B123]
MSNTDIERNHKKKVKNNKTFQCSGFGNCHMQFSRSEHLARHIRKHTGERPFKCYCGRTFSRLDNLRQHAQTIHTNEVINSPYSLSSNSLHTLTYKTRQSAAKNDSKQSEMATYKQNVETLEKNQETYTAKPKSNSIHLPVEKMMKSEDEDAFELSKFQSFIPNGFHSSDQIPDHYYSLKSFSPSLFFHSPIYNSLSSKTDPIPSKFSTLDLNLGLKTILPSNTNSPLPNECQNIQPLSQEIHPKNDFLKKNSSCNNSASITLYNNSCTLTSSNTPSPSDTTNSLRFNDNKLPSITILMDYDLQRSNIISLSNTNEHSLKHNNTQKMSIQFLCNQNITMGGIDILAEVAKIIN